MISGRSDYNFSPLQLANVEQNPTVQNVSWLGSNSIDIKDVSGKLKQILENAIDAVKDNDIEEYLKLRDIYRRDMVALSLMQQSDCGMRIKQQLFILPGCYQRFCKSLPTISFPSEVWGALYTEWGLAVAVCYEGDTARAIKIKPNKNTISERDRFAYCFVSYHEVSHQQGLNELQEIQNIDRYNHNPIVMELIKTIEILQESETIDRLMGQGKFEEAVRVAKRSQNENIRS